MRTAVKVDGCSAAESNIEYMGRSPWSVLFNEDYRQILEKKDAAQAVMLQPDDNGNRKFTENKRSVRTWRNCAGLKIR